MWRQKFATQVIKSCGILTLTANRKVLSRPTVMVYKSTVDYWTVQNMFKIYVLLGDIWRTREALGQKFNHEPLLNMLVAVNAEAPACYAIPGIPALPTSTSGFFGCGTENSAPLSEFKIPDDPIFHVCSLHQQWKRLHVTRPLGPWYFCVAPLSIVVLISQR